MADWNAEQYLKFAQERTQPAVDLANRIPLRNPARIIDIGCGPGNSTQVLADRFPSASVTGIDRSENMIQTAAKEHSSLNFRVFDAAGDLSPLGNDYDVVFSNACIQWIPNHPALLRGMMSLLRPGGVLAVQTPMNEEEPIHKIIQKAAASAHWKPYFPHPRIFYNLTQEEYFDLLAEFSADFNLWQTTYFHRMKSHRDILEWYRSTGLKPYLDALPEDRKSSFEQEVLESVTKYYPLQNNGEIIFRFPRFFFMAVK